MLIKVGIIGFVVHLIDVFLEIMMLHACFSTKIPLFKKELVADKQTFKSYTFNKVFGEDASQQDIFLEIAHLVECAISGDKVCIFCFGRSGSGKTFTMEGGSDHDLEGIVPRTMNLLFLAIEKGDLEGNKIEFTVEAMQVINNNIQNLGESSSKNCDKKGMHKLLETAKSRRATDSTKLNSESSRSHFILRIKITNRHLGTVSEGSCYLVDLAGSEKPDGDTANEGTAINLSLMTLKSIIEALANRKKLVPTWRGTRLTEILEPCLTRESKTLTIIHIDPSSDIKDTLKTLDFGKTAGSVKLTGCKSKTPRN